MDEKVRKYLEFFINTASKPRQLTHVYGTHYTFFIRKFDVGHVFHMSSNNSVCLAKLYKPVGKDGIRAMEEAVKAYIAIHRLTDG